MVSTSLYHDIAARTGGDIYIGVVGPVRTGKSTFIKRFMETTVLPVIKNESDHKRAKDELPQSASGKTVMTTEPKFIPNEAVHITLEGGAEMRIRLVDSVGYLVPGVLGEEENGAPRLIQTPWSKEPLPFAEAAELGTRKVMTEHATLAMLVTTDGSFGELPRASYEEAEERVARELSASSVPFAIILNSATPEREETRQLAYALEERYNAPVALLNCTMMDDEDIGHIFDLLLAEFPITELTVTLPSFFTALPTDHPLRERFLAAVRTVADGSVKMGDVAKCAAAFPADDTIESITVKALHPENGKATLEVTEADGLAFRVISELCGREIKDDAALFLLLKEYAETAALYERLREALDAVEEKGYGIVMPTAEELQLEEPKIVKQMGGYGVRLRASAKSIHMIRANIETELSPTVGTEAETEELVRDLLARFDENPAEIWHSKLFGKTLYDLVGEGLHAKLAHMPEESRAKLSETLERIINEGAGGLICILL